MLGRPPTVGGGFDPRGSGVWHTVLIVLHAAAAALALLAGAAGLRTGRWFAVHRRALHVSVAALLPAVALRWADLDASTRTAYAVLLVLAGVMVLRTEQARRSRPARPGGPTSAHLDAVGFTLISLADGFAIVAAVRSGLPGAAVVAIGAGVVVAGHLALQRIKARPVAVTEPVA